MITKNKRHAPPLTQWRAQEYYGNPTKRTEKPRAHYKVKKENVILILAIVGYVLSVLAAIVSSI